MTQEALQRQGPGITPEEIDISILEYIVTKRGAFASEITREVGREERLWFSDVDESLERLVQNGLASAHESRYGIPGSTFSYTEEGVRLLESRGFFDKH